MMHIASATNYRDVDMNSAFLIILERNGKDTSIISTTNKTVAIVNKCKMAESRNLARGSSLGSRDSD